MKFQAHLIVFIVLSILSHTQGLELVFSRQLYPAGPNRGNSSMVCTAKGDSFTINSVTLTRIKTTGEIFKLLTVTTSTPENDVLIDNLCVNGTLRQNVANIQVYVLEQSRADSDYFTCEVTHVTQSGHRDSTFSMVGTGHAPNVQTQRQPESKSPAANVLVGKKSTSHGSSNVYLSELWFLGEKINKVEGKFQSLWERLDDEVTRNTDVVNKRARSLENTILQRVASVETDISTRVSRLEDRLASILLSQSDSSSADITKTLDDLQKKIQHVSILVNKRNETQTSTGWKGDLPKLCERGMGDDVTKEYPQYVMMSHEGPKKEILCDTHTDGGGWIVFQRRATGDVDFYRDWTSYREGFGSLTGDFWLGNEALHNLTDKDPYELRIDFRKIDNGEERFARYANFRIESESNKYRLLIGPYSGTSGDGMTFSNTMYFSTFDRDNDEHSSHHCAVGSLGAWWYKNCYRANLNRDWAAAGIKEQAWHDGSNWWGVSFTEMKIRRLKLN